MNDAPTLFDATVDDPVEVIDVSTAPISKLRSHFAKGGTIARNDVMLLLVRLDGAEARERALRASRVGYGNDSPSTSATAAERVRRREGGDIATFTAKSQKAKLLHAYAGHTDPRGMHAGEARVAAGLSLRSCFWKRVSELAQVGYIEPTGEERMDRDSGSDRIVYRVTGAGLDYDARLFP